MPDSKNITSPWEWYRHTPLDVGGVLLFARSVTPERIMRAFGMDPASARPIAAADAYQELPYPDALGTYPTEHPWIRVGTAGEWGFAIDEASFGQADYEEKAARELSAGTEVVRFSHTQTIDTFQYLVQGDLVTQFEPLRGWDRVGTDPDRFVPQMRQAGLRTEPGEPRARDDTIALLDMLTLALGIRLPKEVALGPLLTVQRDW
jgi:hypothetical protein